MPPTRPFVNSTAMLGVQFSAGCATCDEDLKELASEVTILKQTKTLSLKLGLKVPRAVLKLQTGDLEELMSAPFTRFSFNSCRLCDYTINKTDTWSLLAPPLPILFASSGCGRTGWYWSVASKRWDEGRAALQGTIKCKETLEYFSC